MNQQGYDIIIIGGGPTGLVLANLLGPSGINLTVLEENIDVFPIPRATHIDEETLRNFQATGLISLMEPHTTLFGFMNIINEQGNVIFEEEIIQPGTEHHFTGSRFFDQPAFERILRDGLKRYPNVTFLTGVKVQSLSPVENDYLINATNILTNESITLNANWVVGCDGGKSVVRTILNIPMDEIEPARDWVIADTLLKDIKDSNLLPARFRYIFKKERLTIFASGIGANNRWEFQLAKNEEMPDENTVKSWIAKDIDLDKITITRISKYKHNSLVARQWSNKRVFLVGDAAHMMPPSAGQGLCSGVRDAINLAWKLDGVIHNRFSENILNTYEQERKAHLYQILKRTLFFSHTLNADNTFRYWLRTIKIKAIQFIPLLKNYLRIKYNTPPVIQHGYFYTSKLSGQHFPQYIIDSSILSDDSIGYNFAFVAAPDCFDSSDIKSVKEKNIIVLHEKINMNETPFIKWLQKNNIDFAIIRADKLIYGTGKKDALKILLNSLD